LKVTPLTEEVLPEKELLALVARGSDAAFRIFYDTHRKKIYSYAVQLTHSTDEADEIVQEVFLKCWLKKEELAGIGNCNAWLHTIARHLFVDRLRRIAREEEGLAQLRLSAEQTTSIDHFILDKENETLLRQSIERLPLQQRAVFELSRRQGLGREEIALQLGISENTVRVHLTRALASMRDFLSRHADLSVVLLLLWSRRS
jgi:RNA polymerase sigma-70 factor (ECF subfamily)